ncbi:MAG: S8 family peptidase, partial [Oscillospiraceae bacterium]|nr:S8 family peptidase [Oscillospiraceae bacterium]
MVPLVVRDDGAVAAFLRAHPEIIGGKALSGSYRILNVPEDTVLAVAEELGNTKPDAYSLVTGLLGREALDASGITPIQRQPFLGLRGRGVLLGFIDTGIDYTLDTFRYEDGSSRVAAVWDQTAEGNSPEGYGFGAEYGKEAINEALASPDPYATVPHRDTVGHGTFLASVAGGREDGAAPDAEIVMVKLRSSNPFYREAFLIPPGQDNAFDSADVMQGVEFILEKARELNRPVSVCLSVGTNLSGHDGFTVFEEYLSRVSHRTGVTICAAAGDEGNANHHTSGAIPRAGEVQAIELSVPQSSGDVYLTVLNGAECRLSVSVSSPTGELVGRVPAKNGAVVSEQLIFERTKVEVYYFFPIEGSGAQLTAIKLIGATPGIWTVYAHSDAPGRFDAWLPLTGLSSSPGTRFLAPNPECTVAVPASAAGVITCCAFDSFDRSLYAASSWGPTRLQAPCPDLAAPGVGVTGALPTGTGSMRGTSVAAAITAGACALLLQWGVVERNEPYADTYLARAYLIRGCDRDPGMTYPNPRWG